ncbi:glycosyl hydrolase-related protein [Allorhizobium sp. BGMRC 0089]|uniref:alpha-mannosidase n=1 Tax=Allorhizobium sonneratiae TaxID=2934936 RepID=UPI0020333205|nr:glycoside hydrolase family 38 C-terminal domain-containing protein [Allorhizobium sonneratiae]MCM2293140.1 glycosyl hydrolase-related protein [Allorhizobium sonneratiae]
MKRFRKLDHLLSRLRERIFIPLDLPVPLVFRPARAEERQAVVAGGRQGWRPVDRDLIWGEPDGYYWFSGSVCLPEEVAGKRVAVRIEAAFGSVMGRSDPQCLVRINGRIVQGGDGNHREFLLTAQAKPGEDFDILIEAGTIEDRRQLGFGCSLHVHDLAVEELYYDLKVPLDVARLLAEDDPRRHFILARLNAALDRLDLRPGDEDRFYQSVERAKTIADGIYAAVDFAEKPVMTATGHTHIDVAWLWRVRETRQKMARSMATALALMQDFPDYRFMYNQCLLLDYLEEDYPELFSRIRTEVEAGRFEIEGALWLEPDVNITGAEALVRHILYGVRYHLAKFGVRPRMIWLPDTFGYSAALPQLMEKAGLDMFVTHKLSWNDTNRMPEEILFWQGIDGSRVPAYFLTTQTYDAKGFNTTYCPDLKPTHVMGAWRRHGQQATNSELFLVYGHGDGGGGPTREMLHTIRRMERGIPGCPKIDHAPMRPFFERLIARMQASPQAYPVWVGELYAEFHRGTLTSVARNKRNNRQAELALRELEMLAVIARERCGHPYPAEEIRRLWDIVLLNQFHDILPGSSIGAVYDDSDRDYQQFFEAAERLRRALFAILSPAPLCLFNATARPRSGLALSDKSFAAEHEQRLTAADGSRPYAIAVTDLPPLALADPRTCLKPVRETPELTVSTTRLANSRLSLDFDEKGRIVAIIDRKTGRNILPAGAIANRLTAFRDMPAQFDAWDIDDDFEDQSYEIDRLVSVEVVEKGPLRAAIRFEWRYERSRIVEIIALEADARQVEFDCFIDWHEHNTLLKTAFPLDLQTDAVEAEIQFGHVRRANHRNTSWERARFECSMQRWVGLREPDCGVALLNDCKYGYDARDNTIRLTLLRSPTYPWAEADQGEHRLRYGLFIHDGDIADVHEAAEDFNLPLIVMHDLPSEAQAPSPQLIRLETPGVGLEAIKAAEEGASVIVRLFETTGQRRIAQIAVDADFTQVFRVDLLEERQEELALDKGRLTLALRPFEIVSLEMLQGHGLPGQVCD